MAVVRMRGTKPHRAASSAAASKACFTEATSTLRTRPKAGSSAFGVSGVRPWSPPSICAQIDCGIFQRRP